MLECNPSERIPDNYLQILPLITSNQLWEKQGNIQPMVRFLKAFIRKSPEQIVNLGRLEPILGIFQKLVASKTNDNEGLDLLTTLFSDLPVEALQIYIDQIFVILFKRLTESKTAKYVRILIIFFTYLMYKFGPQFLEEIIDRIQANMFGMVIEKLFIAESNKISGNSEKKIVCAGLTRLLVDLNSLIDGQYSHFWPKVLETLIAVFELPAEDEAIQEEYQLELEDKIDLGYQTAYCKLMFAQAPQFDLFTGTIQDARLFLATGLHRLSVNRPGVLLNIINQNVDPKAVEHLKSYFSAAKLNLT